MARGEGFGEGLGRLQAASCGAGAKARDAYLGQPIRQPRFYGCFRPDDHQVRADLPRQTHLPGHVVGRNAMGLGNTRHSGVAWRAYQAVDPV